MYQVSTVFPIFGQFTQIYSLQSEMGFFFMFEFVISSFQKFSWKCNGRCGLIESLPDKSVLVQLCGLEISLTFKVKL